MQVMMPMPTQGSSTGSTPSINSGQAGSSQAGSGQAMPMTSGMVMPQATSTGVQQQPQASASPTMQGMQMQMGSGQSMSGMMTHTIVYHDEASSKEGLVVNMNAKPVPYKVGSPVAFNFFVNQKPGNIPVPVTDLQVNHQKLMHVIGIRSDMNEFFHVHPTISPDDTAVMTIDHTFAKPGRYKIWSDIMKDNIGHVFSHPEISVQGDGPTENKQVSLDRVVLADGYQVTLKADATIVKNKLAIISFDLHTAAGGLVEIESYLGVPMHLTIIKDDWKQFIHAHPGMMMQMLTPTPAPAPRTSWFNSLIQAAYAHDVTMANGSIPILDFYLNFPETGLYRAFVQFRPKGSTLPPDEAITAAFWIEVKDKAPFPIPQWGFLLMVSIVSMLILSWAVKKYLKVKPEDVSFVRERSER